MATHRESVLRKYNLADKSYSLSDLSKATKVPLEILQEVYNRGIGAYKTQPTSVRLKGSFVKNVDAPMSAKLSKEQWGYARVYSFLDGNPKHDNDLRRNVAKVGSGIESLGDHLIVEMNVGDILRGSGRTEPRERFAKQLEAAGLTPASYLKEVRRRAKRFGYPTDRLLFSDNDTHKLMITDSKGRITRFGAVGYGDFIIWSQLEKTDPQIPKGFAKKKQKTFLDSHSQIKGDWKDNPYSANNLAMRILW